MRKNKSLRTALAALAVLAGAVLGVTGSPQRAGALDNGLARTPPMGWNGYNHFSRDVTASIVEAQARALVTSGMKADGYTYVNLDGGWDLLQRNADGQLQPDPAKFPHGIKPVADYVHSLGLKFGIYTSFGTTNCAGTSAGSYGHYAQDAKTFASWGVDYVKVDWCDVPTQDYPGMTQAHVAQMLGGQMRDALASTGRPMVFDANVNEECPGDCDDWTWAPSEANMWRISYDIGDNYASLLTNFKNDVDKYPYAGPGGWNDPDMLEVGNGGMTTTEYQGMFSLWAEMDAPLIAGNDLTTMSPATRAILANRQVIAVDQDPLGRQGEPVVDGANGIWVLTKPLANGDRAVVLFNSNDAPETVSTTARQVGFASPPAGHGDEYLLDNLWTGGHSQTTGTIAATVPAHGVVMYRIH
ncbi:MAG: glycoside hydrolase family 27 protein [Nocardiopsaceae bacterium]|nr:glycoside hydrolase family 27 protein [Nocardiopsaceae bacterium]